MMDIVILILLLLLLWGLEESYLNVVIVFNVKIIFKKMHKECNLLILNSSHNTGFIRHLKDTQELVDMLLRKCMMS